MRPLEVYERPHCACCGQLVTWEVKKELRNGRSLQFCSDNCVQVYDSYLVPTYGVDHVLSLDRTVFARD
jgi:hypothetical protein